MKGQRKLLVSSLIMIISCCLLFAGTTFAWFSDSVTSNNNIITAGSLKVNLEYSTPTTDWAPVESDTQILSSSDLWEPGFTKVVNFRITNEGTLSLKYTFNLNVILEQAGINVAGEQYKLSDYLTYGTGEDELSGRDAYVAQATKELDSRNVLAKDVTLEAKGVDYIWLVITMPTTVGNEANPKVGYAPSIQLGFDLLASQVNAESDSFGDDYDKDANGGEAEVPVATVTQMVDVPALPAESIIRIGKDNEEDVVLETAYTFSTLDEYEHASESEYAKWHVDFVVSFDAPVEFGSFSLAGKYSNTWTGDNWVVIDYVKELGFDTNVLATAGSELRLLETAGISINYEELCSLVKHFSCGAFDTDNALAGVTMKVQLVMFETQDKSESSNNSANNEVVGGKRIVVNEYTHTFSNKVTTKSFTVKNDTQLAAALQTINSNSKYWNEEVVINLKANNYSGDYTIRQYPNATYDGQHDLAVKTDVVYLNFVGETGATFAGNVTITGYGYSGGYYTYNDGSTTFTNVTFDAANSIEANGEDYAAVYATGGAVNVEFVGCTFQNASHINLGNSGAEGGIKDATFDGCIFNDGGCINGYWLELNVINCKVTAARNGFINAAKGGVTNVTGCTVNTGKYFLRTSNSGINVVVTDSTVSVYESESAKDLVKFRGSSESLTFTNCTIAAGYTTTGVDANSTLTIK